MHQRLQAALQGLPFREDGFKDFLSSLEASRDLTPLTYPDLADTPPGMRLEALVREREDGWLLMAPLSQVNDDAAVRQRLSQQLPSVRYLNLRTETSRLVGGFRQQVLERLAIGVGVMWLVLWFGLGSPWRALRTLLPVLLAIATTTALLY